MDTDGASRLIQEILDGDDRQEAEQKALAYEKETVKAEDLKYRDLHEQTLKQTQSFELGRQTPEQVQKELIAISKIFTFPPYYELPSEDASSEPEKINPIQGLYEVYKELSTASLRLISLYLRESPISSLPQYAIRSLSAILVTFTDPSDPWTASESHEIATRILSENKSLFTTPEILLDHLLRDTIKPLFFARKHPEITEAGRRAIRPGSLKLPDSYVNPDSFPWKYKRPESISALRWVLLNLQPSLLEQAWPLLVPPVLIILDDVSVTYKTKGSTLLSHLLNLTPPSFLKRTGLAPLMWESVSPILHYLPPLTPLPHSIPALQSAYPTLILLSKKMHPDEEQDHRRNRSNLLDSIIWDGIQPSFLFCGENVHIAEVLTQQISILSDELGVYFVRHLKNMIPLLSTQLSNPFGTAYPPLLLQSSITLRKVILNSWPRIPGWKSEILKGVTICWGNIAEEMEDGRTNESLEDVKKELRNVVKCLRAACEFEEQKNGSGKRQHASEGESSFKATIEKIMDINGEMWGQLFT